ncbi:hypothetical protein Aconfl_38600 [Algoriphagus confluentis]|uniref:Uncharacterized protein n=1 Tax=Algoriphagus confluentis TaxID=1697556 RepID=A0ABQ6PU90_9BACT|nr:hypothetical protein Aconfl_38600 [Algoriphagus confluentis]
MNFVREALEFPGFDPLAKKISTKVIGRKKNQLIG